MRNHHLVAALASATLLAAVPGCGGGDHTASSPLTKHDFIARADSLCKDAGSELAPTYNTMSALIKLPSPSDDQRSQLADALRRYADGGDQLRDRLSDLEPPARLLRRFDRYLNLYGSFNDELRKSAAAIEASSDPPRLVFNRVGSGLGNNVAIIGGDIGFTECIAGD